MPRVAGWSHDWVKAYPAGLSFAFLKDEPARVLWARREGNGQVGAADASSNLRQVAMKTSCVSDKAGWSLQLRVWGLAGGCWDISATAPSEPSSASRALGPAPWSSSGAGVFLPTQPHT